MLKSYRPVKEILERAWAARLRGDLTECQRLFQILGESLPRPLYEPVDALLIASLLNSQESGILLDVLLLRCSLYRLQGLTQQSQSALIQLERALVERNFPKPLWLYVERGLQAYDQGDYIRASDLFGLAARVSKNEQEALLAKSNAQLSLFALGNPSEVLGQEIKQLLSQVKGHPYAQVSRVQQEYIGLCLNFQKGEITKITQCQSQFALGYLGQHFRLWVMSLPYVKLIGPKRDIRSEGQTLGYGYRTLHEVSQSEAEFPLALSEWAERLYLWVWRWLVSTPDYSLTRIVPLLKPLMFPQTFHRLRAHERQLVHNALAWLGLFDPASVRPLEQLLEKLRGTNRNSQSLFHFEHLIVDYLRASREEKTEQAQKYFAAITAHPLYKNQEITLVRLVSPSPAKSPPSTLETLRRRVMSFNVCEAKADQITLDFLTWRITDAKRNIKIRSEPICRAMSVLRAHQPLSVDIFFSAVFGLPRYDSFIHLPRVRNLLSRMRSFFLDEIKIKMESGIISVECDWNSICFVNEKSWGQALFLQREWRELVYRNPSHTDIISLENLSTLVTEDREFSRHEFQAVTRKSRATSVRLLSHWEKKGWIRRVGKGRSTQYRASAEFRDRLKLTGFKL